MSDLDQLDILDAYRHLFTDVNLWAPYVREVCQRHGLLPCQQVRVGVPGSYPAFLVENRWVVKFFGRLFDGGVSFLVEREAGRLVRSDPAIPAVRLVASGELGKGQWPWPYLIFDLIQGVSIGQVMDQVCLVDRLRVAREMGSLASRLHRLSLADQVFFPNHWSDYRSFLAQQRQGCVQNHRLWGTLPLHLVNQIEAFLPPIESLVDETRSPHLIHADLTRDHLLGKIEQGRWTTLALIDFGDAMTGDLLYELVALHLDLFNCDRALLVEFLNSYGMPLDQRAALPRRAMAVTLLHRFNVIECIPAGRLQVPDLETLAHQVWDVTGGG